MRTRSEYTLMFLQGFLDLVGLTAAWYATVGLRLVLNPLMSAQLQWDVLESLAPPLEAILGLWLVTAFWLRLYQPVRETSPGALLLRVVESVFIVGTLTVVVTFFSREFGAELSRSFVLLFVPVSFVILLGARYAGLLTWNELQSKASFREKVAVIGDGKKATNVIDRIKRGANGSVSIAGVILPGSAPGGETLGNPVPVLGHTTQLAELVNRHKLDRVIFVDDPAVYAELEDCSRVLHRMGVIAGRELSPVTVGARPSYSNLYGLHVLEFRPLPFTRGQQLVKRAFDLMVSLLTLLFLAPWLILLAALIKLGSKGPVIYASSRVGKGGRHFTFLKFRSMRDGAHNERPALTELNEKGGKIFKMTNDPRVTPIGRFMRRYSLDELPQLFNVLKGDMSLVGPRPLPAEDLDPDGQSREFAFWAQQRSLVLPGITGLWQIRGRSELPFDKMVELDIHYIQNWSLGLDLRILLETPVVALTGRGAY